MRCFIALSLFLVALSASAFDHDTSTWFKGNTHTHSLWSDGNDFPESIFAWYKDRGYHFVGMSDHNVLQTGEKWIAVDQIRKRQRAIGRGALEKCAARFGEEWIVRETREGVEQIRLRTLEECRELLEVPGEFYLLPAEEVSNAATENLPVHINALNTPEVIPAVKDESLSVGDVVAKSFEIIRETEKRAGVPILAHLNHPNFQWAVRPEDLHRIAGGGFVEVYNGHPGINHLGDETRPGDEAIWDIANTIRLAELDLPPLLGVATDDSHTYHGGDVSPGRGWVVVGAETLGGNAIVEAMRAGRFYASSGVVAERIAFDEETKTLSLVLKEEEGVVYQTAFVGTRRGYDATAAETGIGEVFATVEGTEPTFTMPEDALYLRATVTSSRRHPNPSYPDQKEQAWIQPVGWSSPQP